MRGPSIAIAIPVYNQVSTIRDTIESALRATQDFPDCEVVVSENHSKDGTSEVVHEYRDLVRVVRPPLHVGPTENWNFAANNCVTEWVGMLSGDDLVYPAYIFSMRKAIKKDSSAVFAMGGWNLFDLQSGKMTSRRVLSMPAVSKLGKATGGLAFGAKASFAAYCFRKDAFEEVGGFSDDFRLCSDWILQFDLSMVGALVKTNKIVAQYTVGQKRIDLDRKRTPLYCEDLATFCLSTIWKALDVGADRSLLVEACELHMVRAEDQIRRFPEWRDKADGILRPVYELIGKERVSLLTSKDPSMKSRAKQHLRCFAESILPGWY